MTYVPRRVNNQLPDEARRVGSSAGQPRDLGRFASEVPVAYPPRVIRPLMALMIALPASAVLSASAAAAGLPPAARSGDPALTFWNVPRRGANCQNRRVTPEYWRAAHDAGIEFIRLVPDGWPTRRRDFLIGDADLFTAL